MDCIVVVVLWFKAKVSLKNKNNVCHVLYFMFSINQLIGTYSLVFTIIVCFSEALLLIVVLKKKHNNFSYQMNIT